MRMTVEAPATRTAIRMRASTFERTRWAEGLNLLARIVLGSVLILAGALKVGDPVGSVLAVRAYQLLPDTPAMWVGYALPWMEIVIGVMLLVGLAVRLNAVFSSILMAVFIFGIASVWVRGLNIDCGCFGGGGEVAAEGRDARYLSDILRDVLFLGCAMYLVVFPRSSLSVDRLLSSKKGISA